MDANKLSLCGEESFGTGKSAFLISPMMVLFLLLVLHCAELLGVYLSCVVVIASKIIKLKKSLQESLVEMNTMLKVLSGKS